MATIGDLKPDKRNARKHTPRNVGMIESSIQRDGFGRSVLLANDGTIIAGNATIDAAASAGMENVRIIDTDGTEVIALRRTDVEAGSPEFYNLAISDNRTSELASWDSSVLTDLQDDIDLSAFFRDDEFAAILARVDLERDHTSVFNGDDQGSLGYDVGQSREGMLERYQNTTVRQIVLIMNVAEFEAIIPELAEVRAAFGVDDQYSAVRGLLDYWKESQGGKPNRAA